MAKKKSVSFDAMIKFFMQHYNIPTKKDIDRLMERLDRLEALVKESASKPRPSSSTKAPKSKSATGKLGTASDNVYQVIKEAGKEGTGFAEIKEKTGYGEKKIRNIVFRLNKLDKIDRKSRGIYVTR